MMLANDITADVELVRSMVAKYFSIYDVKVSYESVKMLVRPDETMLESNFESLRQDMKAKGFVPIISYSGGEHAVTVMRLPQGKKRNLWINRSLLVITFLTTTLAGMLLWSDYSGSPEFLTVDNILNGAVFFAIPLMAILGIHELSHYFMSKRHKVDASLPYFIPSIPPFGTFGAFISMRDPMPSRRALVDIGIAGPLGGLAVTIPVALVGLFLTANGHAVEGTIGQAGAMYVVIQPLYQLLSLLVPMADNMALHPTAFAAWVGFLVTAINLLPVGQLDGGHVARGLLGDKAKYLGYATFIALILVAMLYDGWFLFALLVFFLGLNHPAPLNDISKLPKRTLALGTAGLLLLTVTFVPQPIIMVTPDYSFEMTALGGNNTTVAAGGMAVFQVFINNTGNIDNDLRLTLEDVPGNWSASLFLSNSSAVDATNVLDLSLDYKTNATVIVQVQLPGDLSEITRDISLVAKGTGAEKVQVLTVSVV